METTTLVTTMGLQWTFAKAKAVLIIAAVVAVSETAPMPMIVEVVVHSSVMREVEPLLVELIVRALVVTSIKLVVQSCNGIAATLVSAGSRGGYCDHGPSDGKNW